MRGADFRGGKKEEKKEDKISKSRDEPSSCWYTAVLKCGRGC